MYENLLIIFIKNNVNGNVKTRLARDLGPWIAQRIYHKLVKATLVAAAPLKADIRLSFSENLDDYSYYRGEKISREIQSGIDLGEKMLTSFSCAFSEGYRHICLIGTDCYGINPGILNHAFETLQNKDFAIGPSNDGGYYLIGMNFLFKDAFLNKSWGTGSVLEETLTGIRDAGFSYGLVREMVDIDTKSDLDLMNIDLKNFVDDD